MLPLIIFDDGDGRLSPLSDLRAAFDIRTGALTTLERIERLAGSKPAALLVPEPVAAITRERHPGTPVNASLEHLGDVLVINGRWAGVSAQGLHEIGELGGHLLGVAADGKQPLGFRTTGASALRHARGDVTGSEPFEYAGLSERPALLTRPWHVKALRDQCLGHDLSLIADAIDSVPRPVHTHVFGGSELDIHPSARIYPGVVLDLESGPIVIDEHSVIRPAATIIGPAYIGPHSTVLDRAVIKSQTAIGPWCKVAGEVGGCIFQGFANKAHDGHLGDSWIGEWVNLGAGTTNSNLLNTYGEVTARSLSAKGTSGPNERTGEQFLGAVIGDHVKTAISTRIMTGAIIGTGTMWAASAPITGTVAPFTWATDGGLRRYALDKFTAVMHAAMARRKMSPGPASLARLASLHAATAGAHPKP